MHDAKGRPLTNGDRVMIPGVVVMTTSSPEYCNVTVESLATMPGNNQKSSFSAINTKQVLRANEGDDLAFEVVQDGAETKLR